MKEMVKLEGTRNNMNNKYESIIHLSHHISSKHPKMSIQSRAAQFAPYAALTGYNDEINETARLTNPKIELDMERKNLLDAKMRIILEYITLRPTVHITYFIPDVKKNGGNYVTTVGKIRKIDKFKQYIILENETKIPITEIIEIDSRILKEKLGNLN